MQWCRSLTEDSTSNGGEKGKPIGARHNRGERGAGRVASWDNRILAQEGERESGRRWGAWVWVEMGS
jgi:hypothetical protein